MTTQFPAEYTTEINRLLREYSSCFWDVMKIELPFRGIRINTLKTSLHQISPGLSAVTKPLPWTNVGFQLTQGGNLGKHPFFAAGLIYLQEPSAMVPVEVLDPQPGELVLDLCAAPGGKTTQILSRMKNLGTLISNDSNPRRVQALARNIERWGSRNCAITIEVPERLAEHFGPVFDRVLVDAPCSGEGTFRTDPSEIKKWSTSFSKRCSVIQDEILWFAGKMVRPGGILVYSTCTFNQLENEGSVMRFLQANPDFSIDPILPQPEFSSGIPVSDGDPNNLNGTIRIWPHLAPGEGHYIARLRKSEADTETRSTRQNFFSSLSAKQQIVYKRFYKTTLRQTTGTKFISPNSPHLVCYGNHLYYIAEGSPPLEGLKIHHWGWWLGTLKGDNFIPSSAFALGVSKEDSQLVLEFTLEDSDLNSYLRGSPIRVPVEMTVDRGWVLATVEGFPLGWGKIVQGRLKSHIPSWLRQS